MARGDERNVTASRVGEDDVGRVGAGAPLVSVVMPAYNVARYIAEALDSVFAQTFTDYEVFVVNDGSPDTDELERALAPYSERVNYIKQENRGVSAARNAALRAARGRLVAQLDPDDVWEPEFLSTLVGELDRDPSLDMIFPDAVIFGESPDAGRRLFDVNPCEGEVTLESLIGQRCTVPSFAVIRREALERAGLYDETLRASEDYDLWLRVVASGGRLAYTRRVLARVRRRRGSHTSDPVWMCEHILRVYEKLEHARELNEAERAVLESQRARHRALLRLHEGKRAFLRRDVEGALSGLAEANAYFKSLKLGVVLKGLRVAPGLLWRAYDLRDRLVLRTGTKV